MSKLKKALLQAQYSQLWDMAHGMSEMWEGEPVLSKIWRVSKDYDTAMLGTTDVIAVEGGVDASELTLAIMQLATHLLWLMDTMLIVRLQSLLCMCGMRAMGAN